MISARYLARFWDLGLHTWDQQHQLIITCWNQSCSSGCSQVIMHMRSRHSKSLSHSNNSLTSPWINRSWGVFTHSGGFLFLQSCLSEQCRLTLMAARSHRTGFQSSWKLLQGGLPSEVCSKAVVEGNRVSFSLPPPANQLYSCRSFHLFLVTNPHFLCPIFFLHPIVLWFILLCFGYSLPK